jgi:hypothetical protein
MTVVLQNRAWAFYNRADLARLPPGTSNGCCSIGVRCSSPLISLLARASHTSLLARAPLIILFAKAPLESRTRLYVVDVSALPSMHGKPCVDSHSSHHGAREPFERGRCGACFFGVRAAFQPHNYDVAVFKTGVNVSDLAKLATQPSGPVTHHHSPMNPCHPTTHMRFGWCDSSHACNAMRTPQLLCRPCMYRDACTAVAWSSMHVLHGVS